MGCASGKQTTNVDQVHLAITQKENAGFTLNGSDHNCKFQHPLFSIIEKEQKNIEDIVSPAPQAGVKINITNKEANDYHKFPQPGKFRIQATKPMNNQRDLSLAYSPGVAFPCLDIHKDPAKAYDYTIKGNMVAVISNGTAVLGLGNLGALAGKPVMEGKAVLFNKFAGIQSIDLCIDAYTIDEFVNCVKFLGSSFGGINLEDIKGPDCFEIESRLKSMMKIPVFHDDQHGTAIICLAGLINAVESSKKNIKEIKIVCNGAGAAGIACVNLIQAYGAKKENCLMVDTKGVIYKGRTDGMNDWKENLAVETEKRTLADAVNGADVFIGVSAKGALTKDMVKTMARDPIIFAMANPDPEITPEDAREARSDAIIATGRSDYPNQINNVLCFPFIFRGTLDTRATQINEHMKMAAADAIAKLAREPVPKEVLQAYGRDSMQFGKDYIIPTPFDPRLIYVVSKAVAKAAMESGVATRRIEDWDEYDKELSHRIGKI
ncbi:malic enzyme [Stylonychia lemnae]|uniref:Malic enzyme n=1 Tax=Stylonychia lemnae TaxID=5949 RepID=A0A078A1N3_STYLE|nr:malic enzyme [Stylonychia lemnae]|eukprot:CDW74689.1 malic enzyme [Stylonychia lemnae]